MVIVREKMSIFLLKLGHIVKRTWSNSEPNPLRSHLRLFPKDKEALNTKHIYVKALKFSSFSLEIFPPF